MADKMLCGNCGNYHCCNFRPASSASTNILKQTISTKSIISPMQSRDTFSQYQLDTRINPLDQTIISSRAQSPRNTEIERPKSQSTQKFNNRRHYLFKKEPLKIASPIIQQQPIFKRRASPQKLNISKGSLLRTPQRVQRVTARSPILSRAHSRVGSSPARYSQKRTISPRINLPENVKNIAITSLSPQPQARTFNTSPQSVTKLFSTNSPNKNYSLHTQQSQLLTKPPIEQKNILPLKSIPITISNSPSSFKASTIFPRPANVMIPQTISKLQNSKTTVDGQSKVTFQNHHQCSYKDNRCFGFDFLGDQKNELKFDKTGHVKDILRI